MNTNWYIKVNKETLIIEDITSILSLYMEEYIFINFNLKELEYPILSGIYKYIDNLIVIDDELKNNYLNELEKIRLEEEEKNV